MKQLSELLQTEEREPTKQPTPEECESNAKVWETSREVGYAIWYPQMGGYAGRAIAVFQKYDEKQRDDCFDCYVWHDGAFPFDDGQADRGPVRRLHHCSWRQFTRFGREVGRLMNKREA